jgi:hypothetical protein
MQDPSVRAAAVLAIKSLLEDEDNRQALSSFIKRFSKRMLEAMTDRAPEVSKAGMELGSCLLATEHVEPSDFLSIVRCVCGFWKGYVVWE